MIEMCKKLERLEHLNIVLTLTNYALPIYYNNSRYYKNSKYKDKFPEYADPIKVLAC